MDTQVVIAKLAATIYVKAEDPKAAKAVVEKMFADIQGELAGFEVHLGFVEEALVAFFQTAWTPLTTSDGN